MAKGEGAVLLCLPCRLFFLVISSCFTQNKGGEGMGEAGKATSPRSATEILGILDSVFR